MFDIGFSEIVVIAVVALVVLGPERLPRAARTVGHLFGRLQRYVSDVKADINREMELEDLKKLQDEVKSAAQDLQQSVESAARSAESGLRDVESQLNAGASETPPAPQPLIGTPPEEAPPAEPARQPTLPGFDRI
jgi:sec-independent protein translocase protein TatB